MLNAHVQVSVISGDWACLYASAMSGARALLRYRTCRWLLLSIVVEFGSYHSAAASIRSVIISIETVPSLHYHHHHRFTDFVNLMAVKCTQWLYHCSHPAVASQIQLRIERYNQGSYLRSLLYRPTTFRSAFESSPPPSASLVLLSSRYILLSARLSTFHPFRPFPPTSVDLAEATA